MQPAIKPAIGVFSFATGKGMRGVAPARRGPFVSAKGPKTIGARAWPSGCLGRSPSGQGCGTRFAQTVLAPTSAAGLRRSHARRHRDVAPWDGALRRRKKNPGSSMKNSLSLTPVLDIFNRGSNRGSRMTEGGGVYSWEAGFAGDPRRRFLGNRSSWTCFSRLCSTCV